MYHVVKDPLALKYFYLNPPQWNLLKRLDGFHSLDEIKRAILRKFPRLNIHHSDIQRLAADLHEKGLTRSTRNHQGPSLQHRHWAAVRKQILQQIISPFFIRFPTFHASGVIRLFDLLIGWLFTWMGFFIATVLFCSSTIALLLNQQPLQEALPNLQTFFGWPNLLWLWITIGVTKWLHEMGHAVACRRVGRRCHGVGVALLVLSPTLYCDATDSWMCKSKWDRIMVAAGGMYVELALAAIAGFIWAGAQPGLVRQMALNVVAVTAFTTIL
ncbi:MAG: hypothetical protein AAFN70_13870, partial [Planctomycetota bacterium]